VEFCEGLHSGSPSLFYTSVEVTNALAYYVTELVTTVKRFIV
jgi:hypothetical protein